MATGQSLSITLDNEFQSLPTYERILRFMNSTSSDGCGIGDGEAPYVVARPQPPSAERPRPPRRRPRRAPQRSCTGHKRASDDGERAEEGAQGPQCVDSQRSGGAWVFGQRLLPELEHEAAGHILRILVHWRQRLHHAGPCGGMLRLLYCLEPSPRQLVDNRLTRLALLAQAFVCLFLGAWAFALLITMGTLGFIVA